MIITPESKIQQEIVKHFNNNYCLKHHKPRYIIYSVPNGISVPTPLKERIKALDLLNKTGMLGGASDLIIQKENGVIINVEVKSETDQSPSQIIFQQRVEDLGGTYLLVRSFTHCLPPTGKKWQHYLYQNCVA